VYTIFEKDKCVYVREEGWKEFLKEYKLIEAAGGLVKNRRGRILLIFRLGFWDLPKGKVEKNEKITDAAVREVQEECGIKELTIVNELPVTYHTYLLKNQQVIKKTHWFEMNYTGFSLKLIPQTEENITDARWMDRKDLVKVMEDTYPLIKGVLRDYLHPTEGQGVKK
jgi:8-oxo-dGTP pyrophosphatase MutT (NUDIX family)